jgi:murein DD-endopeptidase MepM/ murein hydrolase activator NlpD
VSRREFSIVVIPHSGGRTVERRFSVLGFRLLVALAGLLLLAAVIVVVLALRVHITRADYLSLRTRNAALSAELAKLNQVKLELEQLRLADAKVRAMLGMDQEPPKLDLERLYEALARDSGIFLDSAAVRRLDSAPRRFTPRVNPEVPGIAPVNGFTVSRGWSIAHGGIDLVASAGTPVMASASGVVSFAGWDTVYGNSVRIDHTDRFQTLYGHLLRITRFAGDSVQQGDLVGLVGSTGRSTAPHLHYAVVKAGKPVNPQNYFQ